MPKKPILIPVQVPWCVTYDTPMMKVSMTEMPREAKVTFVARFDLEPQSHEIEATVNLLGQNISIVSDQPEADPEQLAGRYQLVELSIRAHSLRISPALSEGQIIDDSKYNWSRVSGRFRDGEDRISAKQRIQKELAATGIFPDPYMYEVEDSEWIQEAGPYHYKCKHLLILASDIYAEFISLGWTWKSLGRVKKW